MSSIKTKGEKVDMSNSLRENINKNHLYFLCV